MSSHFFNFHGIAGVQVNTADARAAEFFLNEYAHHRVESLPPGLPLVILNFGIKPPSGLPLSQHIHKVVARWMYSIDLSERQITFFATGNRFAVPMIHHMMVHSALRYLVSYKNTLLLHSGAVALDGQSIVFTGPGGTGKTTTTSLLLSSQERNWAVHADDFAFIQPGQGTLAYLTRAHLYRDLLTWIPDLNARLTPVERLGLEVFGRIRQWSGDRIKWSVRIALDRLWPGHELCRKASPAALVLLKRGNVAEPELSLIQPGPNHIEELIEMNFYETRHFLTLLRKYFPESKANGWIAEWRAREKQILTAWVQQVAVFELVLPVQRLAHDRMSSFVDARFYSLIQSSG